VARGTQPARHSSRVHSHSLGRAVAVAAAAALGFGVVFVQTFTGSLSASVTSADIGSLVSSTPDAPTDVTPGSPRNILLIGSDVRDGANASIGGNTGGGMRSDVTIIAHVAADGSRIDMVSIPRDLQVEIPECELFDGTMVPGGFGDFANAFSNGGRGGDPAEAAACTINTVHNVFDLRIDHFAVVDFTGYIHMVDALGGIPMCIPQPIVSTTAELTLDAGPQVLDGATALAYARLRTAEEGDVSGSDLQRITRQQHLLAQTMRTATSKNLFTDASALTQFVRAGAESLTMDEELASVTNLAGLAYDVRTLRADDLTFATIPWQYTDDRNNVEVADDAAQMIDDLRHDRPLSVQAQGDSTSEWDDGLSPEPNPSVSPEDGAPEEPQPTPTATTQPGTVDEILALCRD
jgi:LCP family protein required for cell wall assembly